MCGNRCGVQLLLEHGADVSRKCYLHQTPLHCATDRTDWSTYDICKLLLAHGANCNERDMDGATPLLLALRERNMKYVQLLLDYGADPSVVDKHGKTALHYAAGNELEADVVEFVLSLGFDLERSDISNDYSALHHAISDGTAKGCELLLRRGALVDKKSRKKGYTPLILAIKESLGSCKAQKIQLLLEYGAEVSGVYYEGESVLGVVDAVDAVNNAWVMMCVRNVLMQHMAKIEHLNLNITEDDRQRIESKYCYREHYRKCLQEIERMKETRFYENVAVLSILTKSKKEISRFAKNPELIKALEDQDWGTEFPIYFTEVKKRFYPEVGRYKSGSAAIKVLDDIFGLGNQSLITQKIVGFLGDKDLKCLETEM